MLNELPSREQIKAAIRPWWSGGGTAEMIVDVCRKERATLIEATLLASRMAERMSRGNGFVNHEVIEEQFEHAKAAQAWERRQVAPSPQKTFDSFKCIFSKGVRCPNCGEVHGELMGTVG